MCVATFMISLDVTIVNVALPSIQRELHMTPGDLEWVISAYSLSLAALVPVGGALGDRGGRKRVSDRDGYPRPRVERLRARTECWRADRVPGRSGVGGAAMLALTLPIITEAFPAATRAGAICTRAAIGGTFVAGPVAGASC